jgi:hypothetical protein
MTAASNLPKANLQVTLAEWERPEQQISTGAARTGHTTNLTEPK